MGEARTGQSVRASLSFSGRRRDAAGTADPAASKTGRAGRPLRYS
ncbi:hypothetical protein AB0A77_07965 [Streptomyces varsoviensis]